MRRRELLLILGGVMTAARALHAQQKAMPVIGYLSSTSLGAQAPWVAAFRQGLSETGYVEGQNVAIEYRWAEGRYDRLPELATELASRKVDVIVTQGGIPPARAAKDATSTIPIVFVGGDPIAAGLVASLARPGGNLTGMVFMTAEMVPKRLELVSELVPQAGVIALLVNPNNPLPEPILREVQDAAHAKGLQLRIVKAATEAEIDAAFAALIQLLAGALILGPDPFLNSRREQLITLAPRPRRRGHRMNRRNLIALIGGAALTWPIGAREQQPTHLEQRGLLERADVRAQCHSYTGIERFAEPRGVHVRGCLGTATRRMREPAVGNPGGFERVGGLAGRKMADGEGRHVPGIVLEQERDALVVHDVAMLDAMSA
jgi:putative tryptophan/tyrosine transport system substrate-binding protein